MTAERRIALIVEILRAFEQNKEQDPEGFGTKVIESIIDDPAKWESVSIPVFASAAALLNDAKTELARKSGSPIAALKRIAKESTRDDMRGVWTDASGRSCVCSGYHAVRISSPVAGLPIVAGFDLGPVIRPGNTELSLPTVAELKAHIATHALKRSRRYDAARIMRIADTDVYLDVFRILDVLEALPGAVATYTPTINKTENGTPYHCGAVHFDAANGDGVLMPCRPQ